MTRPRLALLALVPILLAGCSLAGADDDPEPPREIAVGEVVEGHAVQADVTDGIELRLPSGPVHLEVRDDLRAVPGDEVPGELDDVRAADDARLIRLAWSRELLGYGSDVMRLMTGSDVEDTGGEVKLAVVAGGRRTEVPDVGRLDGIGDPDHVYVGLPRDADEVTLEVVYDGLTQTVDLLTGRVVPGRAAELYDLPLSGERRFGAGGAACPAAERRRGLEALFSCGVADSWQLPYVDGLGWAGAGRTWLVADVSSRLSALRWIADDGLTDYRTRLRSWEVRADGSAPVGTLPRRVEEGAEDQRLVFSVRPRERHEVEVRAGYVGRPVGEVLPGAPARPSVDLAGTVVVPDPDAED